MMPPSPGYIQHFDVPYVLLLKFLSFPLQFICYLHLARFLESASICSDLAWLFSRSPVQWSLGLSSRAFHPVSAVAWTLYLLFVKLSKHTRMHLLVPSSERMLERWMNESNDLCNVFIGSHTWTLDWMNHFPSELLKALASFSASS